MEESEITVGAALAYRRCIEKNATAIDLTAVDKVEITFENVESITLRPEAIETLMVSDARPSDGEGNIWVRGFWLRLAESEAESIAETELAAERQPRDSGLARIRQLADITVISVTRGLVQTDYVLSGRHCRNRWRSTGHSFSLGQRVR